MAYTVELLGLIFAVTMLYFSYSEYRKRRLSKIGFCLWSLFWVLSVLLIIFHPYINSILPTINIVRVLDLYMILAFMFLFGIVFYLFVVIKHIEKRVEIVTRAIAMKPIKK